MVQAQSGRGLGRPIGSGVLTPADCRAGTLYSNAATWIPSFVFYTIKPDRQSWTSTACAQSGLTRPFFWRLAARSSASAPPAPLALRLLSMLRAHQIVPSKSGNYPGHPVGRCSICRGRKMLYFRSEEDREDALAMRSRPVLRWTVVAPRKTRILGGPCPPKKSAKEPRQSRQSNSIPQHG